MLTSLVFRDLSKRVGVVVVVVAVAVVVVAVYPNTSIVFSSHSSSSKLFNTDSKRSPVEIYCEALLDKFIRQYTFIIASHF